MSFAGYSFLTCVMLLALFSLFAGCLSTGIGDTWYSNNSVLVNVSHKGETADVSVQVTVYRIANLTQEKYIIASAPVTLVNGENTVAVPIRLEPGSYKLYVYVLGDGDRKTAVIRDIVV
jgi:hypothetical protein